MLSIIVDTIKQLVFQGLTLSGFFRKTEISGSTGYFQLECKKATGTELWLAFLTEMPEVLHLTTVSSPFHHPLSGLTYSCCVHSPEDMYICNPSPRDGLRLLQHLDRETN